MAFEGIIESKISKELSDVLKETLRNNAKQINENEINMRVCVKIENTNENQSTLVFFILNKSTFVKKFNLIDILKPISFMMFVDYSKEDVYDVCRDFMLKKLKQFKEDTNENHDIRFHLDNKTNVVCSIFKSNKFLETITINKLIEGSFSLK